jgi:hypothetical protein
MRPEMIVCVCVCVCVCVLSYCEISHYESTGKQDSAGAGNAAGLLSLIPSSLLLPILYWKNTASALASRKHYPNSTMTQHHKMFVRAVVV